jgi:hypothetical protein
MHRLPISLAVGAVIVLAVAILAFSWISMFRPAWLQAAEPVLDAKCVGGDSALDVTGKPIIAVPGAFSLPTLLLGTLVVWLRG